MNQEILQIIKNEQIVQNGKFIPSEEYLSNLEKNAELLTHNSPEGLMGFAYFYCNSEKRDFSYITLIATSEAARGKGFGQSLVYQVLEITRRRGFSECRLEVRKENLSAFNLYEKLGFKKIEDREEKILMSKKVSNNPPMKNKYIVKLKDNHKLTAQETDTVRDLELSTSEVRWPLTGSLSDVEVYFYGEKEKCESFINSIENEELRKQFEILYVSE